jgi:hypothetical protein
VVWVIQGNCNCHIIQCQNEIMFVLFLLKKEIIYVIFTRRLSSYLTENGAPGSVVL